jgi:hypothetical protein
MLVNRKQVDEVLGKIEVDYAAKVSAVHGGAVAYCVRQVAERCREAVAAMPAADPFADTQN